MIALILISIIAEGQEQTVEYWLQKGDEFFDKASFELADNCYSKALELNPKNISSLCKKSVSLAYLNKANESISTINVAIKLEPDNAFVWETKGVALYIIAKQNEIPEDINETKEDFNPQNNYTFVQKFNNSIGHKMVWENYFDITNDTKRLAAGLYSGCEDCEILFLVENPEGEPVDADLGSGNLGPLVVINPEIGLWKVRVYGYNISSENATFHINLINQSYLPDKYKNRYNESLKCLDRAIELDPKRITALDDKALFLTESYRFNEAIEVIDRSIKIDPLNAYTWYLKGTIFENQRRYEEALQYFDNAIDINPYYLDALSRKAMVLTNLGRTDEANTVQAMIDEIS